MRVLVYSSGADTGGQGWRLEGAFRRHAGWDVEAHNGSRGTLGFPEWHPLPLIERKAEIRRLYDLADVVHLRNNLSAHAEFDKGQGKPTVIHYHGTAFRNSPKGFAQQAEAIGAVQVAATLDLTLLARDVEWVPSPYNLEWLASLRTSHDGSIRIAHFPTNEQAKSTRPFLAAVERLRKRHKIQLVTNLVRGKVRNMPWSAVMEAKASADILYDQVKLGIGNNALEAMGMGLPVVAGVTEGRGRYFAPPGTRALMLERWGHLPFMEATEDTIHEALDKLITSSEARAEYAHRGTEYVQRWHDDAKVVAQLQALYQSAPPTHGPLPRVLPGWAQARMDRRTAA